MAATTDPETGQPVHLVWTRDTTPDSMGWLKWAFGVVVALCGFGAFAAYMAEDTGQIPFFLIAGAFICLLLWLIPTLSNRVKRTNPAIHTVGRDLAWAKKRVPLDQVDRFAVYTDTNTVYNGRTHSTSSATVVKFRLYDGSTEAFGFASLPEAERPGLGDAMERVLPGRRIERF